MAEHTITLVWDEKTDIVTVRGVQDDVAIGDTILFKSDQGKALVIFQDGSPFSDKLFEVFTDLDRPIVTNQKQSRFLCAVISNKDNKLHGNGQGSRTPPIKTEAQR